jgi:hypothetical protein
MWHLKRMIRLGTISPILAAVALALHSGALAEERAALVSTPMSVAPPSPKLAMVFTLKLRLPEGRGLAASLLQAGVDQADAAAAARIAAGHLGDGTGGCSAKIEISKPVGTTGFRLERVELTTGAARTVIERRKGELSLASANAISRNSSLI